jgi:hypothetical protein
MTPRGRGQAMVEFALILPIILGIVFISIGVALAWDVRIEEHKLAYDIARHVAKQEPQKPDGTNNFSNDLVTGCYPNASTPDLTARNGADGQAVIDYHFKKYHDLGLAQTMATEPSIESITTGRDLPKGTPSGPNTDQPYPGGGYYCNMSIVVTIRYRLTVPGWEVLTALYGGGLGDVRETAVAARLQGQYE